MFILLISFSKTTRQAETNDNPAHNVPDPNRVQASPPASRPLTGRKKYGAPVNSWWLQVSTWRQLQSRVWRSCNVHCLQFPYALIAISARPSQWEQAIMKSNSAFGLLDPVECGHWAWFKCQSFHQCKNKSSQSLRSKIQSCQNLDHQCLQSPKTKRPRFNGGRAIWSVPGPLAVFTWAWIQSPESLLLSNRSYFFNFSFSFLALYCFGC